MKLLTLISAALFFLAAVIALVSNPPMAVLSFVASVAMGATWIVYKSQQK